MNLKTLSQAAGFSEPERELIEEMVKQYETKLNRNKERQTYYDSENKFKNLGIAIPDELSKIECAIGWPAKAVDALQERSRFDGFTYEGELAQDFLTVIQQNKLTLKYDKACTSELIHSCVFATVRAGGINEPRVVINFHTADMATALWDSVKERIKCGLVIVETEKKKSEVTPRRVHVHLEDQAIECVLQDNDVWALTRYYHPMGRPLMEVMAYNPSIKRPFGKSRISRAVMSITNDALRCIMRTEVAAEFYTTPQKYLLGASDEAFEKSKWETYIGSMLLISKDEDGDIPNIGQFSQSTLQPHFEQLRSLAARFSGETGVPISSLGVIHDNPASAEAIYAAKEDLVIKAQQLNTTNGEALTSLAHMTLAIMQNKPLIELGNAELDIMPHFKNPAMPSVVSQADAMVKLCSAAPWLAETPVFLEEVGFDEPTRRRLDEARRMLAAREAHMQYLMTRKGQVEDDLEE